MKQQVNDITHVLRGLSAQIESMQKTIDSQHAAICQINRTSQGQLKEIRDLKRMLRKKDKENEELRRRLSKYEEPPKNSGNSSTPPSKEQMKDEIIRRTKSLRKPSGKKPGCFRSDLGADAFMDLHSIIETTKKHGNSPYNAIIALF